MLVPFSFYLQVASQVVVGSIALITHITSYTSDSHYSTHYHIEGKSR
jgi:hypothetical protein